MNVGDLCTRRVITVSTSAPLSEVALRMSAERVGAIVVTSSVTTASGASRPQVAGILTDRDIVRAQLERTADLSRLSAGETMTARPLVLDETESVEGAIADLRARGVRRAPVVAADGTPIGLISLDDLLAHLAAALSAAAAVVVRQRRKES